MNDCNRPIGRIADKEILRQLNEQAIRNKLRRALLDHNMYRTIGGCRYWDYDSKHYVVRT